MADDALTLRVPGGIDAVAGHVAELIVDEGGVIRTHTADTIGGTVAVRTRPGWGKTVALGVAGVVPAVLYRTLGTRDSEDGFVFTFSSGQEESTVVAAAGAGAGLDVVAAVLDRLEAMNEHLAVRTGQDLWALLYDNVDGFDRTQRDVDELLDVLSVHARDLSSEQIHAMTRSRWAVCSVDDLAAGANSELLDHVTALAARAVPEETVDHAPRAEVVAEEGPPTAAPSTADLAQRLRTLQDLADAGLITTEEHASRRNAILAEI